jgi:protein gp37
MSDKTGLEWTDATWNPVGGCFPVSPGCRNCYAQKLAGTQQAAHRIALYDGVTDWVRGRPVFNGRLTVAEPAHQLWRWPLRWPGAKHPVLGNGRPSLIFVADMADLFHEKRPTSIIDEVVSTMAAARHLAQFLTKRPEVMARYFGAAVGPNAAALAGKVLVGL